MVADRHVLRRARDEKLESDHGKQRRKTGAIKGATVVKPELSKAVLRMGTGPLWVPGGMAMINLTGVNLSIILSHSLLLGRCRDLSRMLPDWQH